MSDSIARPPDPDSLDVDPAALAEPAGDGSGAAIDDDADRARSDPDGIPRIAEAHAAETEDRSAAS